VGVDWNVKPHDVLVPVLDRGEGRADTEGGDWLEPCFPDFIFLARTAEMLFPRIAADVLQGSRKAAELRGFARRGPIGQLEFSAAERLSEKAKPVICSALGRRTPKFAKLLISVLLAKSRGLECVSAQPGTYTSLLPRRVFDSRKKAGTETLATTGFGDIEQFNEQPAVKNTSPNAAGRLAGIGISYDDGDISMAARSTTSYVVANQRPQQGRVIARIG
jgi:hypothetical protein